MLPFSLVAETYNAADHITERDGYFIPSGYNLQDVTISIAALGCHGNCQTYKAEISDSGEYKIQIDGKTKASGSISSIEFYKLIASFYEYRFFFWSSMFKDYHVSMTPKGVVHAGAIEKIDGATYSIKFRVGEFEKFVILDSETNDKRWRFYKLIASKLALDTSM